MLPHVLAQAPYQIFKSPSMFSTLVGSHGHLTGFIQLEVFPCHLGPDESICVGFGGVKILKNLSLLQAQEYQIFGKNISCLLKKLVEKLRQRSLLKHGIKFYLHHFPEYLNKCG